MKHKLGATHRNGERATYRCSACKKLMRYDGTAAPVNCPRCGATGTLVKVAKVTGQMEADHERAEGTG